MTMIEKIRTLVEDLETKDFYIYTGIFLIICSVLTIGIVFQYYRRINYLEKEITEINDYREDRVRVIREQAAQVKQQRNDVDAILAEDINFKIGGYFKDLLVKLELTDKKIAEETALVDREDNYRESELDATFEDMNMKQLATLLQELERNRRISTKRLEVTKSKKKPETIEVRITIGTLLLKAEI